MPLSITDERAENLTRGCIYFMVFLDLILAVFFPLSLWGEQEGTWISKAVFSLGSALLLAGLGVTALRILRHPGASAPKKAWVCPVLAGLLSCALLSLAYSAVGMWPLGEKTAMIVDLHHQYAPLLCEWRERILTGNWSTYSFHIGLGTNYLPAFAYYLASPLNGVLLLFPEKFLAEGILVITLLKNALAAGFFAVFAQKRWARRDGAVVFLSVCYALMMYMLAYSWNVMWLDIVVLLPLVTDALEDLLAGKKRLPYTLLLALSLVANYYIAYMLCVFLVLYTLVWLFRQKHEKKEWLGGLIRFATGSLLAGGLAAALLIPTALALLRTSAAGESVPDLHAGFHLFDLFGRFFADTTPTVRSGNLPNVYCGVLPALLVPLYFVNKEIPLRRKLSYGGLLGVMLLSCTLNHWDLLWHGFHTPNDLPYRFSFLISFVVLLLAGQTLTHLSALSPKRVLISLGGTAVYLVLWDIVGEKNPPEGMALYINFLLLAVYGVIVLLFVCRKIHLRAGVSLLTLVVTAELLFSSSQALLTLNRQEYYTARKDYVSNAETVANAVAMDKVQERVKENGFCRIEHLPRSTCMDTALYHYGGITTFASSNPYLTADFMGDLGYAFNGVNSYLYNSFVPGADSLFGVKYVVLNFQLTNPEPLTLVDRVSAEGQTRFIYENTDALPVGYCVSSEVQTAVLTEYTPFTNQETLIGKMLGQEVHLYAPLLLSSETAGASIVGSAFEKPANARDVLYKGTVSEKGRYYAYVDCRAAEKITVNTYSASGEVKNAWNVTTYEPYIIDMGVLEEGDGAGATIVSDDSVTGNIHIVQSLDDAIAGALDTLRQGGLAVTSASENTLEGTVTAKDNQWLMLSIPYDTGWTVTVDGVKTAVVPIGNTKDGDGAFLGVPLAAGTHTVRLSYTAPGFTVGLIVSGVSLLLVIGWGIVLKRRQKAKKSGK